MPFGLRKFEDAHSFGYKVINTSNGALTESYVIAEVKDSHYVLRWENGLFHENFGAEDLWHRKRANDRIKQRAYELLEEKLREEAVLVH